MADGKNISDLHGQVRKAVEEAYERGLRDGASQMRNNIIAAAQWNPGPAQQVSGKQSKNGTDADKKRPKAPRGAVQEALGKILANGVGLTLPELEESVAKANDLISPKSVYNHLKEKEGQVYRKDGGKWFLLDTKSPASTEGVAPAPPQSASSPVSPQAATVAPAPPVAASAPVPPTPPAVSPLAAVPPTTAAAAIAPISQLAAQATPAAVQSSPQGETGAVAAPASVSTQ